MVNGKSVHCLPDFHRPDCMVSFQYFSEVFLDYQSHCTAFDFNYYDFVDCSNDIDSVRNLSSIAG